MIRQVIMEEGSLEKRMVACVCCEEKRLKMHIDINRLTPRASTRDTLTKVPKGMEGQR
jgi:hypothetical protein